MGAIDAYDNAGTPVQTPGKGGHGPPCDKNDPNAVCQTPKDGMFSMDDDEDEDEDEEEEEDDHQPRLIVLGH
ncbi:hypothetical protein Ancab_008090 [Ancistrocladus abbreviatus]